MGTDRADHVLDAIDGALADYMSPDAMRWAPEAAAAAEDAADLDAEVWETRYADDGVGFVTWPTGRTVSGEVYVAPVDTPVLGEGWVSVGFTSDDGGYMYTPPPFRGPDLRCLVMDEAQAQRMRASMQQVGESVRQMVRQMVPPLAKLGRAFREAGLIEDPTATDEDPRERALRAARNRSTGPARDPFRHRGNR